MDASTSNIMAMVFLPSLTKETVTIQFINANDMNKITEIKLLCETVRKLLSTTPEYRDDDRRLVAHVWMNQCGGIEKLKNLSAYDFLKSYCRNKGILSSHDSITRARRKVQEQSPELRGNNYYKRMEQESVVRKEIPALP